jgi:hypothetical protein
VGGRPLREGPLNHWSSGTPVASGSRRQAHQAEDVGDASINDSSFVVVFQLRIVTLR